MNTHTPDAYEAKPAKAEAECGIDNANRANTGSGSTPQDPDGTQLEHKLMREKNLFEARPDRHENRENGSRWIILDLEYAYDRDRHSAYQAAEGAGAERSTRWPFHRPVAASWIVMHHNPVTELITIEQTSTIAIDTMDERMLVQTVFDVLNAHKTAVLVTWGGENKDVAVLRLCASKFGLLLPNHLRDPSPKSHARLDLCYAVSGGAKSVHLPEYAWASDIPAKPSPSKDIGPLVQAGKWHQVREQALADVLTTAVIGLRHFKSHGVIGGSLPTAYLAMADAAAAALPSSQFVTTTFAPWARHQATLAKLHGVIYRAA
ncbi:hypothetical protein SOQ14_06815 [Erythrobacter sp. T5W1-R]|uniref:hypothetical protein n=1 Tax=Erythrobacter sp. T5W1-R TaxID=3101752 RepID=UPI002B00031C|nr:hypothetical protein [Erythrobacter sp. T5W1-R]MEA1618624.1 hypothetical protein [Erythrobacter sp. T5W1-R]